MRDLSKPLAPTYGKPKKRRAARKTLTVSGSQSNVKGKKFNEQTSTGVSTFTKKRRDGTVKKTISTTSTRTPRDGRSDARTNKTTKTKYKKDGSVKKSKTLKRGSRKTDASAAKAARDMRGYGSGEKVSFPQKTKKKKKASSNTKSRNMVRLENKANRLAAKGERKSAKGQKTITKGQKIVGRANQLYKAGKKAKGVAGAVARVASDKMMNRGVDKTYRGKKKLKKGEKISDRAGRVETKIARKKNKKK